MHGGQEGELCVCAMHTIPYWSTYVCVCAMQKYMFKDSGMSSEETDVQCAHDRKLVDAETCRQTDRDTLTEGQWWEWQYTYCTHTARDNMYVSGHVYSDISDIYTAAPERLYIHCYIYV